MKLITKEELRKEFLNLTQIECLCNDEAIDVLAKKLEQDYLITDFDGVYVYMGTYKLVHECAYAWYPVHEVLVDEQDSTAEYQTFYELDTGLKKCINVNQDLEKFKQNNTIIYIPNVRHFENKYTFEDDFKKIRRVYLEDLCLMSNEDALSFITSEEYIKEIFSIENYMKQNNLNPNFYKAFYDAALCNSKNQNKPIVLNKVKKPM